MEQVLIGNDRFTQVFSLDEKGNGNANHHYVVIPTIGMATQDVGEAGNFAEVNFQNGPILEVGVNGCHNEDLIAIVIHRLQGFQDGAFKCRENALAITKLEEALQWLNYRTTSRQKRGVEGTHSI